MGSRLIKSTYLSELIATVDGTFEKMGPETVLPAALSVMAGAGVGCMKLTLEPLYRDLLELEYACLAFIFNV